MKADVGLGAGSLGSKAKGQGEQLAHAKTLAWLARAGLVARGVVYGVIGILALKLALGDGGKATNQPGALKTIAGQSFGELLLVVLAIGLAGYSLWRLTRAAVGHGAEQQDETSDRIAALASGIAYGILAITAVKIITDSGAGSGTPKGPTAGILGWTGGPVLVGIAMVESQPRLLARSSTRRKQKYAAGKFSTLYAVTDHATPSTPYARNSG